MIEYTEGDIDTMFDTIRRLKAQVKDQAATIAALQDQLADAQDDLAQALERM